jgi:hypothetical protein
MYIVLSIAYMDDFGPILQVIDEESEDDDDSMI